jgi:predicted RNase H-like HicB family nuclease
MTGCCDRTKKGRRFIKIMKTIIKLKIKRFEEQGKEYFVVTNDDLQGLVAEGNTVEETVAIAEDVARFF